jgi:GAF domain-containing protein
LRVGDEIIGALDVQSTQESAFDREDIALLGILADQIAIAIDNARLFQQNQAALEQAEQAYQQYVRQEWDSFLGVGSKPRPVTGFERGSPVEQTGGHETE